MDKRLKALLLEIFPLVLEVNTTTDYKASFNIQPCFDSGHQIWYQVTSDENVWGYCETAFWNDVTYCRKQMRAFKKKLEKILKEEKNC